MSPKINHLTIGEIQKTAYLTATITSVDSENDTASFTGIGSCPSGSDIPIFYHCEKDSEERDNGALEDAAGAFAEDDEVIVMCEIVGDGQYEALRVMGFVDKPKACMFYIDLTVNEFIPAYLKTIKLVDAAGMVHIADSSSEEPSKAGPFNNVVFPAKVYLHYDGNAPNEENNHSQLFTCFTENPTKEFTVIVKAWHEGTITVDGITLGDGEQQKFSWDYSSRTWSPIPGGVDPKTTKFMTHKTDPTSTGYNQACKESVVNAYEGTRILLTGEGAGNPQTMEGIYEYCLSATRVHDNSCGCDGYYPYYGLVENLPVYTPPFDIVIEELYYADAWRVAYLLADDIGEIAAVPIIPINFTAFRLGMVKTYELHPPHCGCTWDSEENDWDDDIISTLYHGQYAIVGVKTTPTPGFYFWDTPFDCYASGGGWVGCGENIYCITCRKAKIGVTELGAGMAIMTDADGHGSESFFAALNCDFTTGSSLCSLTDDEGNWLEDICYASHRFQPSTRHEFKAIPTPEDKI